jgi:hypothetical protein
MISGRGRQVAAPDPGRALLARFSTVQAPEPAVPEKSARRLLARPLGGFVGVAIQTAVPGSRNDR